MPGPSLNSKALHVGRLVGPGVLLSEAFIVLNASLKKEIIIIIIIILFNDGFT